MSFPLNSIVRFIAGSPPMVVARHGAGRVLCKWYDPIKGGFHESDFEPEQLELAETPEPREYGVTPYERPTSPLRGR